MQFSCVFTAILLAMQGIGLVRCEHGGEKDDIIDLSYPFDGNTLFWPGQDPFVQTIGYRGSTGNSWYETNSFQMGEHTGTHLDAPAHFSEGKQRVDAIPKEHFIGPGVKVDISSKASTNPDALLEVEDLMAWEKTNGDIPEGAILMVFTGWGKFYPDRASYFGSDRNDTYIDANGTSLLHFPGISPDAADWLIGNRDVVGVGIDTPSLDYGQSTTFSTHVKLMDENIYGLENVANLDNMPTSGSTVYALPMHIKDGSGAPVRIFAIVGDTDTNGVMKSRHSATFCLFISIALIVYNQYLN
ncbi:isatin hydrolase-like [Anneissia japonica]|uniref:isatin hydrolase-like n=1 Tax=Anneissia japonica TaxID=1529436 RepID=UPI0014259B5E|nr:isatin hydrolase-like [Anneissia japonica]